MCRGKPETSPPSQGTPFKRPTSQPVRQVGEESEDDSDDSSQPIYTVEQGRDSRLPPIKVHVELDRCTVVCTTVV